ncbi:MAG: glycosyltransferase family 4 protein [Candidatus Omnitrophota bacterium]
MNILLLTNHLNIGGITRYVLNLSFALHKQGDRVFIGSSPGWGEKFLSENEIPFLRLPLKTKSILSPRLISAYFILKRFIEKENIDLIHAQTRITQFLAFLLSRRLNIPYICTFHGFYRPHYMRRLIPCLGNLTIAISQAVGRHLLDDFKLNKQNLRVIYNSISPQFSCPLDKDYHHLKGSPTLGIVARLSKEKGHRVLFSAFRELIKDYPQARLLVVGTGKIDRELKDWVGKEKLNNQIIFLGNIGQLSSLFQILDLSVLPSTQEGLGYSILEAQVNGVPVIASSVGGITELIKHKKTGILVKPGNPDELYQAIKLLLGDILVREKIIENAKQQIQERFSLKRMALQVKAAYKELLSKAR